MPKTVQTTRQRILESAYGLFYREGFGRMSMEAVAEDAGLTKRTLYNHFASKDDLLAAVLEAQADLAAEEIRRWCREGPTSPEALIDMVFTGLRDWSRTPEWRGSGFTRAAMELAWASGHPARKGAALQKTSVERALSDALSQAGIAKSEGPARMLVVLLEGAMALRLIHGEESYIDIADEAARLLIKGELKQ